MADSLYNQTLKTHILRQRAAQLPIVGVIGPRQSGKTTLVKHVFSDKLYVSLEDLGMIYAATI